MSVRLRDLLLPAPPVTPATTAAAAFSLLLSEPGLPALAVLTPGPDGGQIAGIVSRARLAEALAGPGGRDIHAARPVSHLMDPPLVCEAGMAAALAAKHAADSRPSGLSAGVIVTEGAAYAGLVSPAALLKAVAAENALRARTLKTARQELERLRGQGSGRNEERAALLGFLGHEIRTPLTGILGVADLLEQQASGAQKKLARTIAESGQHLDRLLADLLDLSRLDAGKLSVMPAAFDLRDFIVETRDLWQPRFQEKNVALRFAIRRGDETRIESDAGRLRQILFNLVSNAFKFTERGQVTVQVATEPVEDGLGLILRVSDTGRGIPDADKARLFRSFEQAGDAIAAASGTGLGLAIARGLTKRLGGEITAGDNPGGGAVFTVRIPVRRAGPRLAVQNTAPARPGRFELGAILLAEDHETSAFVICEALSAAGWVVETVPDAEGAIARAGQRRFQLILTDIHMPGGGESVLREIRSTLGPNRTAPVIAITADTSPERRAACLELGFSGLIEKPVRPRALVAAVADVLLASNQPRRAASA